MQAFHLTAFNDRFPARRYAQLRTRARARSGTDMCTCTDRRTDPRAHGHKHGCTRAQAQAWMYRARMQARMCARKTHARAHRHTHTPPPPPPPPPPPGGAAALSSRTWLCVVTCSASRSRQGRSWCQPASTSLKSRGRASQVGRMRQWAGGNGSRKRLPAPKATGSKAVHVRFLNPRNFYQWHMSCSNPCTTGSSATGQKQFMCDW